MRVFTDRMSYSIFAVLVGGILLSQAIALGLYRSDRAEAVKDAEGGQLGYCLEGIAAAIQHQPAESRRCSPSIWRSVKSPSSYPRGSQRDADGEAG